LFKFPAAMMQKICVTLALFCAGATAIDSSSAAANVRAELGAAAAAGKIQLTTAEQTKKGTLNADATPTPSPGGTPAPAPEAPAPIPSSSQSAAGCLNQHLISAMAVQKLTSEFQEFSKPQNFGFNQNQKEALCSEIQSLADAKGEAVTPICNLKENHHCRVSDTSGKCQDAVFAAMKFILESLRGALNYEYPTAESVELPYGGFTTSVEQKNNFPSF
jgi:hypothetical protein